MGLFDKIFPNGIDTLPIMQGIGIFLAIVATVLVCLFILPEKKREKLPKLFQQMQDLFNFKTLLLEKLLKFLYTFVTLACVCVGICMLFSFSINPYAGSFHWYGVEAIIVLIGGPIVTRVAFELIMMFIILVKNTTEINKKLKDNNSDQQ